jgi:hypothetical protein
MQFDSQICREKDMICLGYSNEICIVLSYLAYTFSAYHWKVHPKNDLLL